MNIQKIYNAQIYTKAPVENDRKKEHSDFHFGLTMPKSINKDIVSFQSRGSKIVNETKSAIARREARAIRDSKLLDEAKTVPTKKELTGDERTWGVEYSTSQKIREMVIAPQKQIHDFFHGFFDDLQEENSFNKKLILKISDRAKSVVSIMEKSATRKWNSIKEILNNMTDLNGAKIVMNNKTGKADVEAVIDRFIPLIKTKQIQLKEIELQRPEKIKTLPKKEQEEYDYVSKAFLDKLEDIQEQVLNGNEENVEKIVLIDRPLPKYTKGNYCALHLLLQLNQKGSRPFELQIMGARMSQGKAFDDKRFKYFDGKQLDKKYDELVKLWEPLMSDENKAAKERFLNYCKDANFQLRLDELHEFKTQKLLTRLTGFFKSVKEYNLPPEYDINTQYKLMRDCESKIVEEEPKQEKKPTLRVKVFHKLNVKQILNKFGTKKAKDHRK